MQHLVIKGAHSTAAGLYDELSWSFLPRFTLLTRGQMYHLAKGGGPGIGRGPETWELEPVLPGHLGKVT